VPILHHLTDIHVGPLHYTAAQKFDFAKLYADDRNLALYIDFLESDCSPDLLPDCVLISGDLTSYASERQIAKVKDNILRLVKVLKTKPHPNAKRPLSPYVCIVPGNHDLDWSQDTYEEKIQRYARMSDDLFRDGEVLSAVYSGSNNPVMWDFGEEWNLLIYLFNTTSLGGIEDPALSQIHESLVRQYGMLGAADGGGDPVQALSDLKKASIKDPGFIDPIDLRAMKKDLGPDTASRVKIGLMHHNLASVPSEDIEVFDSIINAGPVMEDLIQSGFDLIFHGHRHFLHAAQLRPLELPSSDNDSATPADQGLFIISGDTLGCKEAAPFLEVRLHDTQDAHSGIPPATLVEVRVGQRRNTNFQIQKRPWVQAVVSRSMHAAFSQILRHAGRKVPEVERESFLRRLEGVEPALQGLVHDLGDWGLHSDGWTTNFHIQLDRYGSIYATDIQERWSLGAATFAGYLRQQYEERLIRLRASGNDRLSFAPEVYEAILRTGWEPSRSMWPNSPLEAIHSESSTDLKIVRILLRRPTSSAHETRVLEALDFDHKLFAIPLFVLEPEALNAERDPLDFAIGLDPAGRPVKCYAFETGKGVKEQSASRSVDLLAYFNEMLANRSLRTVDQVLDRTKVMIQDPQRRSAFARTYDRTRSASPTIVRLIERHIRPDESKLGLDIGCGTGNYTIPFMEKLRGVVGLELLGEMLGVAKSKSSRGLWVQGDALAPSFQDESFDAIWAVSVLHYFNGERQRLLFSELRRLLKSNGVLVVDTEFAEQQPSLWLVAFFPSLKQRFENANFNQDQYRTWLQNVGFSDVCFETYSIPSSEQADGFLRIGQRRPELYLDGQVRAGIPAFVEMRQSELDSGLKRLSDAIQDGTIEDVIRAHEEAASMEGIAGVIVARRL